MILYLMKTTPSHRLSQKIELLLKKIRNVSSLIKHDTYIIAKS